jgi:glycosyltransferase involved in cell wall biosynthesis
MPEPTAEDTNPIALAGDPRSAHAVLVTGAVGPNAPSFRVRATLLGPALARHGVRLVPQPLFDGEQAERFARGPLLGRVRTLLDARRRLESRLAAADAGTVVIQRQVDLLASRKLERAAMSGRRLVYDVDDAIWFNTLREAHGNRLAFVKDSRRKAAWLAANSAVVLASNRILADWLAPHASGDLHVIPSVVDTDRYDVRVHEDRDDVALGWIGSASTSPHLDACEPVLADVARALRPKRVRLLTLGAPDRSIRGVEVTALPWSEAAEAWALKEIDIGLMPLPDNQWSRGKSAYKALQYMAAGVPVVADAVGVSGEIVGDGVGGLIPRDRGGWTAALLSLARDVRVRADLGARGRQRVVTDFSVARWAPEIARLLS